MSNQPKRIEKTCNICKRFFSARVKDVRRGFGRLCSPRCRGMYSRRTNPRVAPVYEGLAPLQLGIKRELTPYFKQSIFKK